MFTVLEARGLEEEFQGPCDSYVKVLTSVKNNTKKVPWGNCKIMMETGEQIYCTFVFFSQVGMFPDSDPEDRQKTHMIPNCRNPIFLQTFSL